MPPKRPGLMLTNLDEETQHEPRPPPRKAFQNLALTPDDDDDERDDERGLENSLESSHGSFGASASGSSGAIPPMPIPYDDYAAALVREFCQKHRLVDTLKALDKERPPDGAALLDATSLHKQLALKQILQRNAKKWGIGENEENNSMSIIELLVADRFYKNPPSRGQPVVKIEATSPQINSSGRGQMARRPGTAPVRSSTENVSSILTRSGTGLTLGDKFTISSERLNVKGEIDFSKSRISDIKKGDLINAITELDLDNGVMLGKGAGGMVSKVLHKPSGTYVAVKKIQVHPDDNDKEVVRELGTLWRSSREFQQSSKNLQAGEHTSASGVKFIVQFYGAFFHESSALLALELCDSSLDDLAKGLGKIDDEEVLRAIAWQVLRGLYYLHKERHIMHRDIKAANILITKQGVVKVTDFGVASAEKMKTFAAANTFVGTFKYMSPERLRGEPYHPDSDLWSLGLSLWSMYSGNHPINAASIFAVFEQVKDNAHLQRLPIAISSGFRSFLAAVLKVDHKERPPVQECLEMPWFQGMTDNYSIQILSRWVPAALAKIQEDDGAVVTVVSAKEQLGDAFSALDGLIG